MYLISRVAEAGVRDEGECGVKTVAEPGPERDPVGVKQSDGPQHFLPGEARLLNVPGHHLDNGPVTHLPESLLLDNLLHVVHQEVDSLPHFPVGLPQSQQPDNIDTGQGRVTLATKRGPAGELGQQGALLGGRDRLDITVSGMMQEIGCVPCQDMTSLSLL